MSAGAPPQTPLGSLQPSPDPYVFKGPTSKRREIVVLNNFIKNLFTVKSNDLMSALVNGQTSRP